MRKSLKNSYTRQMHPKLMGNYFIYNIVSWFILIIFCLKNFFGDLRNQVDLHFTAEEKSDANDDKLIEITFIIFRLIY
jgi:hypothetical protein